LYFHVSRLRNYRLRGKSYWAVGGRVAAGKKTKGLFPDTPEADVVETDAWLILDTD